MPETAPKLTGLRVSYYMIHVPFPERENQLPYTAECGDIIDALELTFNESCIVKAIWRSAAARLGNGKPGTTALYDAEKVKYYAERVLKIAKRQATTENVEQMRAATRAAFPDQSGATGPGIEPPKNWEFRSVRGDLS